MNIQICTDIDVFYKLVPKKFQVIWLSNFSTKLDIYVFM